MRRLLFSALLLSAFSVTLSPLHARSSDTLVYQVKRGDTLIALANAYFSSERHVRSVQRLNRIRNPRRIPVGMQLKIPRNVLRYDLVPLEIRSFSGPVRTVVGGRSGNAAMGAQLGEGDEISTGANGFVSLSGVDGARVSLPSNSRARIISAKRYLLLGAIDIEVRMLAGRSNVTAPKLDRGERFRVGTPVAVTAVRGTEFRVAHDPESGLGAAEVTEGLVSVTSGEAAVDTPAGFGVAASAAGVSEPEQLLPAPDMIDAGRTQTGAELEFSIDPVAGASGYRTQIARDASFLEIIGEAITDSPSVRFAEIDDGRLFVRSRGVASSRIEGLSQAYSFRRKRLGVSGSVESGGEDDPYKFVWRTEGEGQSYQAVQIWQEGAEGRMVVDEIGLVDSAILISELEPGVYHWRVGTLQVDDGEIIKVWGAPQKLTVSE